MAIVLEDCAGARDLSHIHIEISPMISFFPFTIKISSILIHSIQIIRVNKIVITFITTFIVTFRSHFNLKTIECRSALDTHRCSILLSEKKNLHCSGSIYVLFNKIKELSYVKIEIEEHSIT